MNARMNATPKSNMSTNTGSFVVAPINSMKNMSANVANAASNAASNVTNSVSNFANSIKNSIKENLPSIYEPINDSIEFAKENSEAPFISTTVMIALGALIILFIIFVIFYEQIVLALEIAWHKLKKIFGYASNASNAQNQSRSVAQEEHEAEQVQSHVEEQKQEKKQNVDHAAINKLMPSRKDSTKQVFNIATNKYKYTDAEPLCKAFGAELATYDQVKEAWDSGADWCNYGWVKGQSAIYPTQQATYDKLQAGPEGQRGACGVPGINGGHFDNPELRFGVNCYGSKPNENEVDNRSRMSQTNHTPESIEYGKKMSDFKANMNEIPVNPFSNGTWSQ